MEYTKRTVLKMPHGVMNVNVIKNDAILRLRAQYDFSLEFSCDFHAIVMRLSRDSLVSVLKAYCNT